jgi:hypothetical protein
MEENLQAGRLMNLMRTAFILLLLIGVAALAQTAESIALPPPDTSGGIEVDPKGWTKFGRHLDGAAG